MYILDIGIIGKAPPAVTQRKQKQEGALYLRLYYFFDSRVIFTCCLILMFIKNHFNYLVL